MSQTSHTPHPKSRTLGRRLDKAGVGIVHGQQSRVEISAVKITTNGGHTLGVSKLAAPYNTDDSTQAKETVRYDFTYKHQLTENAFSLEQSLAQKSILKNFGQNHSAPI